jgi:hypothetical protein
MDEVLTPHSDLTQEEGDPTDKADLRITTQPVLPPPTWIVVRIFVRILMFITSNSPRSHERDGRHGEEEKGETME